MFKGEHIQKHALNSRTFLFAALIVGFFTAYWPIIKQLVHIWSTSDDYSHGFFVAPVSLYIIWSKKNILSKIQVAPEGIGILFIIISLLFYVASYYAEIFTAASFSIVPLGISIVIYYFGYSILKELAFPIWILVFMIPIPAQIYSYVTLPLQLLVSTASASITEMIGIPIFQDGNILNISEHRLQVVSACSGLRSIISLLVLSVVFGFFTLKSNVLRAVLFFSGIPVAICVNIVRILLMILAFEYFDFDLTKGTVHDAFGILIYLFALISIFVIQKGISAWDKFD